MSAEPKCALGSILYDYHADDHVDPPYAHIWVWGINGTLLICMLFSLVHRAKSKYWAREADAAVDPSAKLTPGNRYICGKVEYAEGQYDAISVHVEQHGTESKSKNGWTHQWTEKNRTTEAQPFYVRRADGERVRIEPGDKPLLVDKPDRTQWKARHIRIRTATLSPGEEVIVQGSLNRGPDPEARQVADYRSGGQSWVLTAQRNGQMEVCAEKLGDRHRKRANAFRSAVFVLLLCLSFVNLFFLYYQFRLFGGEDTCAEITRKDISISVNSKGQRTLHYKVYVEVDAPGRPDLDSELDDDDWENVEKGTILGFRYVPSRPKMSELGTGTSTHSLTIVFALLVGLFGLGMYVGTRDYRRWYEGKLNDSGSGRLPDFPMG